MRVTEVVQEFWRELFPGCAPVWYLLRDAFPNRWVRFHSLPESKRYPEDEEEMGIVLYRHNAVLEELARGGERLLLISCGYSLTPEVGRSDLLSEHGIRMHYAHWHTTAMHELDPEWYDEPFYRHFFYTGVTWEYGVFDAMLRLVANDEITNLMIVSTKGRWCYCPYDGGADVILETEMQRDSLKERYLEWLSERPNGL